MVRCIQLGHRVLGMEALRVSGRWGGEGKREKKAMGKLCQELTGLDRYTPNWPIRHGSEFLAPKYKKKHEKLKYQSTINWMNEEYIYKKSSFHQFRPIYNVFNEANILFG